MTRSRSGVMRPALLFVFAGSLLLCTCTRPASYGAPQRVGTMPAAVRESSGLAASRRDPRLLWTHNDSGGQPVLYAIDPTGTLRGELRVADLKNIDWEGLAAFELDGKAWLLIADTGDNAGRRADCALYIVAEPAPAELSGTRETVATVAWQIPVRYPDGPCDCEAVAVDAREGSVYLLAKRTVPHGLYRLPLRPPAAEAAPTALPVAQLPSQLFPQPSESQSRVPVPTGRYRAQPTDMAFAADGSAAVVLSYGDVLLFPRRKGERWENVLRRPPVVLAPHGLAQAEGVAVGADHRTIYVSSEGDSSGIIHFATGTP